MAFKLAQTFYVSRDNVRGAENVTLTSVDLYFKSKPRATSNRSGITKPGVSIVLLETDVNDVPNLTRVVNNSNSRVDYDSVVATSDASVITKFNFSRPVIIKTDRSYAIAVLCDGDEDYVLWTCKEGEQIVGSDIITGGATAPNVGKYFLYSSRQNTSTEWLSISNTDLKFTVYCGVFAESTSNTEVSSTYILPSDPTEYIIFDRYDTGTVNWKNIGVGELVYQETPILYGPVNVSSNSTTITTSGNINFSNLLTISRDTDNTLANTTPTVGQKGYIVLRNGSSQSSNVTIREIVEIVSNTEIRVDRLPDFTNQTATFSVTAVGKVDEVREHWYTGRVWNGTTMEYKTNQRTDILKLSATNANSTVRFVNNMVQSIAISSGGLGYSNSDVITVYPVLNANTADANDIRYIESYANAVANVVTNGAGTITGIAITNAGFGLISNVAYTIATAGGTSANLVISVGSTLKSEKGTKAVAKTIVTNVETHRAFPSINIKGNQHHDYKLYQHYPYYTLPGTEHILRSNDIVAYSTEIDSYTNISNQSAATSDSRKYVLASTSNEAVKTSNVSIRVANGAILNLDVKSSSILEVNVTSNNVFSIPMIESDTVYNFKYIVNNSISNENKGAGTALARHISKRVTFVEGRSAEDIVVYMDAYRPAGTDLKVYAKLLASTDSEPFDDKDWTELELKSDNAAKFSSTTNKNDLIEFTWGLKKTPTTVSTLDGFARVTNGSTAVTGVNTTFTTSLQVNDLIKIYSELFPETYIVAPVTAITNDTNLTIATPATVDLAAAAVKIDLVGRRGITDLGTPGSAWSYKANSFISRYYDSMMGSHDGYSSFAIKVVLLTNDTTVTPEIANIRAVGVSA
jgi:hypothetical protein